MAKEGTSASASIQNNLLAALPPVALARLLGKMTEVEIEFDTIVYKQGKKIENVYFPLGGIISLLASVDKESTTEVGIVGREGMVGLPIFLGESDSFVTAVVQGMGSAMQISSKDFQDECATGDLDPIMRRFANSMLVQISQSAVCFRFHVIEQRLARWLLMTSDRMEAQEFRVTQTFLSNMLGVRREAVNRAAKSLESNSFIKNRRNSITISDRKGLESAACVCYEVIRAEESRVSAMRQK